MPPYPLPQKAVKEVNDQPPLLLVYVKGLYHSCPLIVNCMGKRDFAAEEFHEPLQIRADRRGR